MNEPIPLHPAASCCWRSVPAETLHFVHWEGQSVLFHETSGRTHLLNDAMVVLLTQILRTPRTLREACRELFGAADPDPLEEEEDLARVQDALGWLEELGLVERCG